MIISIFVIYMVFTFTQVTVDEYIAQGITKLSDYI